MINPKAGAVSLFAAAGFYGLYGIFSRLIGDAFGNFNQNWIRSLIVVFLISIIIAINGTKLLPLQRKDIKWIILWFLSGSWATVLTFIAFNNLSIGTTYLIIYAAMILAGFLSGKIFFNENLNTIKIISLGLTFFGLLIIYNFSINNNEIYYVFLSFISGLMTGIWNTISKKFSDNYPNNQLVLMDAACLVIAALIGVILFKEPFPDAISNISWVWIGLFAVIQTINVGLVVYGFKNIEAQIGSIILPIEVLFAILFSLIIFSEYPTVSTVIGGVFILTAAILPNLDVGKFRFLHFLEKSSRQPL